MPGICEGRIVIVTGAMLGKLVVESGAAQRIATALVEACGEKRMAWAMAATGFIVGIPLFYGVGFVLMVPIIFAVIGRYRLPPLVVGLPALASMSVAHGLLPPHPAPTALVAAFHANYDFSDEDLIFWTTHILADAEHGDEGIAIVSKYAQSAADRKTVFECTLETGQRFYDMWDLYRAVD